MLSILVFALGVLSACRHADQKKLSPLLPDHAAVTGAQPSVDSSDIMVGTACGFAGTPTSAIRLVRSLVDKKDFGAIRRLLYSRNGAFQYVALQTCSYFAKKGKLQLSTEDSARIRSMYGSQSPVAFCSGCMMEEETTLGKLLKDGSSALSLEVWLNHLDK